MLEYAHYHTEALQRAFNEYVGRDEMLMFFFPCRFFQLKIEPDTSKKLQFVSVDKNKKVVGMYVMRVDWNAHYVYDFMFISFDQSNIAFSVDLARLVRKLFIEYEFRKIKFKVIVGHSIERAHNRIAKKYGRVVGVFVEDIRLMNGRWYDVKHYELVRVHYLRHHSRGGRECPSLA